MDLLINLDRTGACDGFVENPGLPHCRQIVYCWDFPGGSVSKESAYNVQDLGWIPGSGRFPGEGNGNSLQYSCLENPMDRGAW